MYSLKVKLIMITIGIFIVFDDTYASPRIAGCINVLIDEGYFSKEDGIANYVNLFSKFVNKYHRAIERFDELVLNSFSDQPEEDINFLDQLYMREMIPEINKIEMDNADIWCTSHAVEAKSSKKDGEPQEGNPVESCKEELKTRGFIYTHGITNYAFHMKQPSLLPYFTTDLKKEPKTSNDWCTKYSKNGYINGYSVEARKKLQDSYKDRPEVLIDTLFRVCVGILKVHGFRKENTGQDNYNFLMTETRYIDKYTKYIVDASKLLKVSPLIIGPSKWCLERCLKQLPKEADAKWAQSTCKTEINKSLKEINTPDNDIYV
ncbi:uncharacterized protein LOC100167449 precursor [Acyrthosiphon pisum]|uniref:ACYPI008246 protein n=1 Tax=Acyrthosiphon pisum TaxID=7029 RepID=C4WWK1_ACYPI|nr:uncharacterized protein LOC100167449 precursor [Acyrthosiphon pisum]BAH72271.1 ACYPI008246 [Acyrthosiphon pisum]|eukprot:NP_001156677.1 uncharacterized protein LOC100167449 precursor [Acyrthosiphon pisum]